MHVSGFISIIGKPNVGKSTFLNHVLNQKIAITSSKPQTTRNTIRGIYNDQDSQIIFIDTPGIHEPKHTLGKYMTETALRTLNAVDIVLFMISGTEKMSSVDEMIIEQLTHVKTPVILLVNKIDLIKDIERLNELIELYKAKYAFKEVLAISALEGIYTKPLLKDLKSYLPEGPKYYPEDQVTDHPEKFLISELIREKVLHHTHEEVPHSVMVLIDNMEHDASQKDLMTIHATIVVERDSQKGIIIGKGGKMIKKIGTDARGDILNLLGEKIFLDLHCKVVKNWRNKELYLKNYGYKETL